MIPSRRAVLLNQASPAILVRDAFNRADSATTMGSAETGQAWAPVVGTWGISSGQAYPVTTVGNVRTQIDPGAANVEILVRMNYQAATATRILFRYAALTDMIYVSFGATSFSIFKVVGNSQTTVTFVSFTPVVGQMYALRIVAKGTQISATVDGTNEISGTVADAVLQTPTPVLLWATHADARFDDLVIRRAA